MTPNSAQHHFNQAYTLYDESEDFPAALQECEAALEIQPDFADAHNLRGIILEELGRIAEAREAYQQALHFDPDFAEAEQNLAALEAETRPKRGLVTIATFSYPTEAYIPKTKLESEDIPAFVADADTVTMNWLFSNAIGGVKLQVRAVDAERAREILFSEHEPLEWDDEDFADDGEDDDEYCPVCHSANIHYERYATRLIFLSWLILSFPLPFLKRQWKCNDCAHTWKDK